MHMHVHMHMSMSMSMSMFMHTHGRHHPLLASSAVQYHVRVRVVRDVVRGASPLHTAPLRCEALPFPQAGFHRHEHRLLAGAGLCLVPLRCISLRLVSLRLVSLRLISLRLVSLRLISLRLVSLRIVAPRALTPPHLAAPSLLTPSQLASVIFGMVAVVEVPGVAKPFAPMLERVMDVRRPHTHTPIA